MSIVHLHVVLAIEKKGLMSRPSRGRHVSSWWLNQPLLKNIISSKMGSSSPGKEEKSEKKMFETTT